MWFQILLILYIYNHNQLFPATVSQELRTSEMATRDCVDHPKPLHKKIILWWVFNSLQQGKVLRKQNLISDREKLMQQISSFVCSHINKIHCYSFIASWNVRVPFVKTNNFVLVQHLVEKQLRWNRLNCNILAAIWCLFRMFCRPRRTIRGKPGACFRKCSCETNKLCKYFNLQQAAAEAWSGVRDVV